MSRYKTISRAIRLAVIGLGPMLAESGDLCAAEGKGHETIVFIRHGEKPEQGLGQLDCQGLNRALALPKVLESKFGRPIALFAPNPSKQKNDGGTAYDYVRPLATIEPSAIYFGLPVDTSYGFDEVGKLKDALEQPAFRKATIIVAWEHKLIDVLVKQMMVAYGGTDDAVPKWQGDDFDSIYEVTLDWADAKAAIAFKHDQEGLNGQQMACPF